MGTGSVVGQLGHRTMIEDGGVVDESDKLGVEL